MQKCQKAQESWMLTKSLFSLGFKLKQQSQQTTYIAPLILVPCTGLTCRSDPKIDWYLSCTAVAGGGAPSCLRIAAQLFPKQNK